MDEKKLEKIKGIVEKLLASLEQPGSIEINQEESIDEKGESFPSVKVVIETDDPGSLIGFHGKTLSALQLIIGMIVYRQLGEWLRVVVDVNNYRQEQTERLNQIAISGAQKAKFSGQSVILSPMTPYERRLVHIALADFDGVSTASQGEDSRRCVVITPDADKSENNES